MLDLIKFGKNPFASERFGIASLVSFTTDNYQKMIKNNPSGKFTERITATAGALSVVEKAFVEEGTSLAIRKARKQAKDAFREHLWETIAKIFAGAEAKYGAGSVQLTECFAEGRGIFQTVRDDMLADKLAMLINGLTKYQPDLADGLAMANDLQTTGEALHDESESSSGGVSVAILDRRTARKALAVELFKNLLTIALNFPEEPEKIPAYMQQTLLAHDHPVTPAQPTPPAPAPTP